MCIDSHEKSLVKMGMDRKPIQHAIRLASVIHAVAVTVKAEEHLA
jgi:alkyl hydroperoxide reductase subunit D